MSAFLEQRQKALVASYARSVLGAIVAVLATGNYGAEDLLKAAIAAMLPPIIRWLNPKDSAFGRGA